MDNVVGKYNISDIMALSLCCLNCYIPFVGFVLWISVFLGISVQPLDSVPVFFLPFLLRLVSTIKTKSHL